MIDTNEHVQVLLSPGWRCWLLFQIKTILKSREVLLAGAAPVSCPRVPANQVNTGIQVFNDRNKLILGKQQNQVNIGIQSLNMFSWLTLEPDLLLVNSGIQLLDTFFSSTISIHDVYI